jgi:hypothetical protein
MDHPPVPAPESTATRIETHGQSLHPDERISIICPLLVLNLAHLNFGFVSGFDIRISDL